MKKFFFLFTYVVMSVGLITSCQPPAKEKANAEPNMDSIRAAITAIDNGWAVAENKKDVDAIVAYHVDDAQIYPPDQPAVIGRDNIREYTKNEMASDTMKTQIAFASNGLIAMGDKVIETGTMTITDTTGKVITTGKFMTVYEKRDGNYLVIRDMWNMDK